MSIDLEETSRDGDRVTPEQRRAVDQLGEMLRACLEWWRDQHNDCEHFDMALSIKWRRAEQFKGRDA